MIHLDEVMMQPGQMDHIMTNVLLFNFHDMLLDFQESTNVKHGTAGKGTCFCLKPNFKVMLEKAVFLINKTRQKNHREKDGLLLNVKDKQDSKIL